MTLRPNKFAAEDPQLKRFAAYLAAERNASVNTSESYAARVYRKGVTLIYVIIYRGA